jgi:hypothetical protein
MKREEEKPAKDTRKLCGCVFRDRETGGRKRKETKRFPKVAHGSPQHTNQHQEPPVRDLPERTAINRLSTLFGPDSFQATS